MPDAFLEYDLPAWHGEDPLYSDTDCSCSKRFPQDLEYPPRWEDTLVVVTVS
jgi:hypothetical protein